MVDKDAQIETTWRLLSWNGELQWFAKKPTKSGRAQTLGGRLHSPQELSGTIRNAEALGWNLYLNVNPTTPRSGAIKLNRDDVRFWRYIVIDIDPIEALQPPDFHTPKLYRATRIFSGRGYQCWQLVETLEDKARAERVMKGYLAHLNSTIHEWGFGWLVDTSCSDLARVVRCPGSINQKTGQRAVFEYVSDGILSQAEYLEYEVLPPETRTTHIDAVSFEAVMPYLSKAARHFIMEGAPKTRRHHDAWHTAKTLHELGVSLTDALEWIKQGAERCEDAEDGIVEDAISTVRKIYGGDR